MLCGTVAIMARRKSSASAQVAGALAPFAELFRAWGREGGKKGAKARWSGVSPEERSRLGKKAAKARWSKRGTQV
jgi:hypothetical protein